MPGITELLVVLVIVMLVFGTKKLKSLGGDLGGAIKSFRGAMKEADELGNEGKQQEEPEHRTSEGRTKEDRQE